MSEQQTSIPTEEIDPTPARSRPKRTIAFAAAGALVAALAVGGYAAGRSSGSSETSSPTAESESTFAFGPPSAGVPGLAEPARRPYDSVTEAAAEQTAATSDEQTGIVTIDTEIGYGAGGGAGSGMVLTPDGLVLTNHHVVEGATTISVTIESTGETYDATLVGADSAQDIAVLQLDGATNLDTVTIDGDGLAAGDGITAVGNSDGEGVLMSASGTVTSLGETITVGAQTGSESTTLSGLIMIDADVVSGDSGGAVLDSQGEVVGVTTAATTGSYDTSGYAIDIDDALAVVDQIVAGDESGTVTLGYPAFLGVQGSNSATGGAGIVGVVEDSPAATPA